MKTKNSRLTKCLLLIPGVVVAQQKFPGLIQPVISFEDLISDWSPIKVLKKKQKTTSI